MDFRTISDEYDYYWRDNKLYVEKLMVNFKSTNVL